MEKRGLAAAESDAFGARREMPRSQVHRAAVMFAMPEPGVKARVYNKIS